MILRRRTADWTRRFLRRTTIPKRLRSKPESRPSYRWKIATSEAPQIYVNESFNPADDATGLFTYSNVYVGSQQKADEIDRKINKALVERFGTDEPGELIDPEKNVRVWYIARFLDGFVQSTNIDEVKRIVYGEVESTGTYHELHPFAE